MHRDQKIGLSLAVLLIGFAGAFCFRQEPLAHSQSPTLARADELDLRIQHLPIRAYTEREGVQLSSNQQANTRSLAADGPLSDVLVAPFAINEDGGDIVDLFAGPPEPLRLTAPPPPVSRPLRSKAQPVPSDRTTVWQFEPTTVSLPPGPSSTPLADSQAEQPEPTPTAMAPVRTYTVQPGDTLSGIAHSLLGHSARYGELFEANRDELANPNSLRPGIVLKIPEQSE